jgi:PAS domain S-box-containing protein
MVDESVNSCLNNRQKMVSKTDNGKYKTLFESVNAAAFLTTLDCQIVESNQKSCELFGYSWDEIGKHKIDEIFPDEIDTCQLKEEIISKGGMNFESKVFKKDGTEFPAEISTSLFTLDNQHLMLVLIWDITERKAAEDKLKASEERYRTIFENSAVAIMLTDENEKIISWNKYTEKLLEMDDNELKLKAVESLYPPEEWVKIRAENIRDKGMQHHLETKMFKKNGDIFPVDISISVFKDESGKVVGSIGVIKDISEQKEAEKKLRESEEKYSGLFECTTDGMIVLDARGEVIDVNSRSVEIFGLDENELVGNNFLSMGVLTPKALSIVVKQFQELLSKKQSTSNETEIINKHGHLINVELTSFFLLRKDNEIDNFVLIIRDIMDRKQAEIKLAREHELLQTLMDSIPDSIYFKDEENKFIKVNKAKASHSNVTPEEMIGKTDFDFLPQEQAVKAFEDDEEVLKTGKFIINKVEKINNYDGSQRWVSVTKIPRFDAEGNIIGTMGISRDITEWKKLEELYKKEKETEI